MNRRVVGSAIVASWLASLGWLGWRTWSPGQADGGAVPSVRLGPVSAFYAVLAGDVQIGTAGITLDTTALGYRLTEVLSLDLPDSQPARHVLRTESVLSRTLRLQRSAISRSEAGRGHSLEASLEPDSGFVIRAGRGGANRDVLERLAPQPGMTVAGAVPFQLAAAGRLRPRGSLATPVLDPLWGTVQTGLAEVRQDSVMAAADSAVPGPGGEWVPADHDSVRAWLVVRQANGMPVREWTDAQGRVLSREHGFGVRLAQSPFEVNYTNYQSRLRTGSARATVQLSAATRLVDLAHRPDTSAGEVRAVLRRSDGPAWPGSVAAFSGGRQTVRGDTVVISRFPMGADSSPPTRWRNTPARSGADSAALAAALAEALQGPAADPDTIHRLVGWVAHGVRYLDREAEPTGLSTALRLRRAGLEGKTALLVALARAAGYPARAVTGVDLSRPSLPAHTWAEVWRGGWQAVDPVLGNVPASPWLLRVTEGQAARPLALIPMIGTLRATLVSPASGEGRQ